MTANTERFIGRNVELGKVQTASRTRKNLKEGESVDVSSNTVCRAFGRRKLHARIQRKVPMLTREHMRQRLNFAKKYKSWTLENWKQVIWSDETKVCLFGSEGRRYYWKRRDGPTLDHHFRQTKKFGGGGIFLWGCMTSKGIGYLAKIDNGLDAELYTKILSHELMYTLSWYGLKKRDVIFQHDNDPKHTAKMTRECIERLEFATLDWPSQSPDLNPMEHIWVELKKRVANREVPHRNIQELWDTVQEEWENIGLDTCMNLIESMPRRIASVIEAKGGHTRY